jgi:hypothetical protein
MPSDLVTACTNDIDTPVYSTDIFNIVTEMFLTLLPSC